MQTAVPQGREAVNAWRSLTPQARTAAWAAVRRGAAPPDAGLGLICAGYGQTMARRLLVVSVTAPFIMIIGAVGVGVAIALAEVPEAAAQALLILLFIGYVGGILALRVQRRRYRQLQSCGLFAVEAAHAGAPDRSPAGWGNPYQSEFTVPYSAYQTPGAFGAPVAAPPVSSQAGPVSSQAGPVSAQAGPPAEPVEIRARRAPTIVTFAILALLDVFFWARVVLYANLPHAGATIAVEVIFVLLACFYTFLIVVLAIPFVQVLRQPVVARFTPDGWELPNKRYSGSWTEVREIRARVPVIRRAAAGSPGTRFVVLIVADPQAHLRHKGPVTGYLARRVLRKFGSPLVIAANRRSTIGVVELISLLARYTSAPVNWG